VNIWKVDLNAIPSQMPVRPRERQPCSTFRHPSLYLFIFLSILCICSMIACLCRWTNWLLEIIFCLSIIFKSLTVEVFQIIFKRQPVNWLACTIRKALPICSATDSGSFALLSIEMDKSLVWVLQYKVKW